MHVCIAPIHRSFHIGTLFDLKHKHVYTHTHTVHQERMIIRGGGRACNFARFGNGRNNQPVLFLEGARNTWRNFVPLCSGSCYNYLVRRYKYSARFTGVNWSYTLFLLRVQSCALHTLTCPMGKDGCLICICELTAGIIGGLQKHKTQTLKFSKLHFFFFFHSQQ